jgi:hypothetical protein
VALGLIALGCGALTFYYGSPIPQSLIAKARVYGTPGPLAGRAWWDWIIPFQYRGWPTLGETNMLLPLMVLMFPALVVGLRQLWEIRGSALSVAVAAGLVVWLGYALSGVSYFFWYFVVPLGAIVTACAVGLPLLLRGRMLYVSIALVILGVWTIAPLLYVGRAQGEYFAFADAGVYLRKAADPGDRVLLEPIGLIGWEAPVHVIDEVGLVTPWIAERRLRGPGWYTDVVEAARPRWLVLRRNEMESGVAFAGAGAPFRSLAERDSVFAHYRLATELEPERAGAALQIWRRER